MIFRITFVFAAIGPFVLLATETNNIIHKNLIKLIVFCGCAITVFNAVNYRETILNSRFQYIAAPIPFILDNHYDQYWILRYIDNNRMLPTY